MARVALPVDMPRAKTILLSDYPYHVWARCINRDWFQIPMPMVWDIMCRQLYFIKIAYNIRIYSFVLMQNHFHLLISTPEANLSDCMANFMKETSHSLTTAGNRVNNTYGQRYGRSIIKSTHYFDHVYKYIYRNPVQVGLCSRVENYPYSTLYGALGRSHLYIPIEEDIMLFEDTEMTLKWLNKGPKEEDWKTVAQAMKKMYFALPKNKNNKKGHDLEFDML